MFQSDNPKTEEDLIKKPEEEIEKPVEVTKRYF